MKSFRWTLQALLILITLSGVACSRGKSKGTGSRMPRVTEAAPGPDLESKGDLAKEENPASVASPPKGANTTEEGPKVQPLHSDGAYTVRPLEVIRPLEVKTSSLNTSGEIAAVSGVIRTADIVGAKVTSAPTVSFSNPVAMGPIDSRQIVGPGPGWPAGDAPSQTPAYSGLIDQQGQAYTDNKQDEIMQVLVHKMNSLPADILADSQQMAMTVNRINLAVDRQIIALDLDFKFTDKIVSASFSGYLHTYEAATQLVQRSGSEQFLVHVTCADRPSAAEGITCRNAILMIQHLKEGRVCRTVYAVHRWMMDGVGDGHMTLSDEEFELSTKIYEEDKAIQKAKKQNKKYDKEPVVKNRAYRAFLRVAGNTVHYNRLLNNEYVRLAAGEPTAKHVRVPRFNFIGVRSWAVAYGPAFFEITMGKNKPGGGNLIMDTSRFAGLLTKPRVPGEPTTAPLVIEGDYTNAAQDELNDERFAAALAKAELIDNDGRGHLTMALEFSDSKVGNASTRLNFNSLPMNVLSASELMRILP